MLDFRDWLDDACMELCIPKGAYVRTYNCILRGGLDLEKLSKITDEEIMGIRNCGKQTADYIKQLRMLAQQEWEKEKKELEPVKITLCGPLRNMALFDMAEKLLTAKFKERGCIIFSPYLLQDAGTCFRAELWPDELKEKVHFSKIEMSDMIVVIDGLLERGEWGSNTRREIQHAVRNDVKVYYLSKILKLDI